MALDKAALESLRLERDTDAGKYRQRDGSRRKLWYVLGAVGVVVGVLAWRSFHSAVPVQTVTVEAPTSASGAVLNFVGDVEARTQAIDAHLTDIMMAQDFHDLTGQVVAKVVALASDLEDSLVKLLVQVVPPDQRDKVDPSMLHGPVVDPAGRTDVVANQGEVDDLLASLGF